MAQTIVEECPKCGANVECVLCDLALSYGEKDRLGYYHGECPECGEEVEGKKSWIIGWC